MRDHGNDHGGNLDQAMAAYGAGDWIDLSTGINRRPWPLPDVPAAAWRNLPTRAAQAGLIAQAVASWGLSAAAEGVALGGAQAAIQLVPRLRPAGKAAVLGPTYNEHAACLLAEGWQVRNCTHPDDLRGADLAVIVNPNNPDGRSFRPETLLALAESIGLLVVDESFGDVTPELSLLPRLGQRNLLVLRSFGKFYGLAGLRLGFAFGAGAEIAALTRMSGPWPVSGPAIEIGGRALADSAWASAMRAQLATRCCMGRCPCPLWQVGRSLAVRRCSGVYDTANCRTGPGPAGQASNLESYFPMVRNPAAPWPAGARAGMGPPANGAFRLLASQRQQARHIQMGLDMVGQGVQNRLDSGRVVARRGVDPQLAKIGPAEGIFVKQPMQIAAANTPTCADGPLIAALDPCKGAGAIGTMASTNVDFIALNRQAGAGMTGLDPRQPLVRRHHGFDVKKTQARRLARRSFNAIWITNLPAQHLVPPTNAQNMPAAPDMGGKINVPALRPQISQIAARGFGSRQNHQPRIPRNGFARAHHDKVDTGFGLQRIKIIEIGNARESKAGDRDAFAPWGRGNVQRILGRQEMRLRKPRHHAKSAPASVRRNQPIAIVEKPRIAAKFVDEKPSHHLGIGWVKNCFGPDNLSNHASPVNVTGQNHRHIGGPGKSHVSNVARPQVHLCRAACALDDDKVMRGFEPSETFKNRLHQLRLQCRILPTRVP